MGLKFFLSSCLFWPPFPSSKIWSKIWIKGRKVGVSKTLIYHLSLPIGLFPFSKICSMEDDGFETFSFFCNCWWQPFPLPKSLLWVVQGAQEWTCYPTNFSFQSQRWLRIQYVPHLKSKIYEITSVKSHTLRAFQQYQDSTLISLNCIVFSSLNFQWKTLYNIQ